MDLQFAAWIAVFVTTLWLFYKYMTMTFDYWEKRGITFAPPKMFIGSGIQFRETAHEIEAEKVKKYGRLFGYFEGRKPAIVLSDPDLIRNVLVKDFPSFTSRRDFRTGESLSDNMVSLAVGEKWKRIRSIITPTFSTGKIKRMTSILLDSAETLCKNFEKFEKQKQDINAKRLFGTFSMDVIASTAFGTKIDSHNDPDNEFVAMARKVFANRFPIRFILFFFFPKLIKMLRMGVFSPSVMAFFRDVTLKIIEERKRTGEVRNDFLQLLLDARSTDENIVNESRDQSDGKLDLKRLSHDELVAQCIIFFLAGYDTTATTLSFTAYMLAINPDCQEKVIQEIDAALAETKGEITYEAVQNMKYLDNVISETLRMFPPVVRLERQADEDYELGDTGITVTKDMIVGIPVYSMHHDPEFYPNPEKFDPNRFTSEEKLSRHQYVYLPFGAGPRNCVGMRFAMMEIKICLVKVFSRFRLKKSPKTKVPMRFRSNTGLIQPCSDILLIPEKRTDIRSY